MCDYTRVEFVCTHLRYTVRAWCRLAPMVQRDRLTLILLPTGIEYQKTHKRCPPNVVAVEYRLYDKCGMLLPSRHRGMKRRRTAVDCDAGDCKATSRISTTKTPKAQSSTNDETSSSSNDDSCLTST